MKMFWQQEYFICDWWFNVDCSKAEDLVTISSNFFTPYSSGLMGKASQPSLMLVNKASASVGWAREY
jgi:hypothetical protein